MTVGPRYFLTLLLYRPTMDENGSLTLPAATAVSGALWDSRDKAIVGGQGETIVSTAQAFVPSGTDVAVRDQVTVSGESRKYEVMRVIRAYDDRNRQSHVGLSLREL